MTGRSDEERTLSPAEIALNRVRLAVYTALEQGATRPQIEVEVADAKRIFDRRVRP